jgi:hypothetical protein
VFIGALCGHSTSECLIADGVAKLPVVYAPPRSLAVLLLLHAEKIEAANRE